MFSRRVMTSSYSRQYQLSSIAVGNDVIFGVCDTVLHRWSEAIEHQYSGDDDYRRKERESRGGQWKQIPELHNTNIKQ